MKKNIISNSKRNYDNSSSSIQENDDNNETKKSKLESESDSFLYDSDDSNRNNDFQISRIKILFERYDTDNNHILDLKEFTFLIKDLIYLRDNNSTIDEALIISKKILQNMKLNNNSIISIEEFINAMNNNLFNNEGFINSYFDILASNNDNNSVLLEQKNRNLLSLSVTNKIHSNNNIEEELKECEICYTSFPLSQLWGDLNNSLHKSCKCQILICVSCLCTSAKSQIKQQLIPTCPNMITLNNGSLRRCESILDSSLISSMFKEICPLCDNKNIVMNIDDDITSIYNNNKIININCNYDIYHIFCIECLQNYALTALNQSNYVPKCPRYAECKSELCEKDIRNIFENKDDKIEEYCEKWYQLKLKSLINSFQGNKKCPSKACSGYLISSLEQRKQKNKKVPNENIDKKPEFELMKCIFKGGVNVRSSIYLNSSIVKTIKYNDVVECYQEIIMEGNHARIRLKDGSGWTTQSVGNLISFEKVDLHAINCNKCNIAYCWDCLNLRHPNLNCIQAMNKSKHWHDFLKKLVSDSASKNTLNLGKNNLYY